MRVLLLLTALGLASPVAAATPASPPAPVPPPASTLKDVKDDLRLLPRNMRYDGHRIQVRPGSTKPNPEGKLGPRIG